MNTTDRIISCISNKNFEEFENILDQEIEGIDLEYFLFESCYYSDTRFVKKLLEFGADTNKRFLINGYISNKNALYSCCEAGNLECLKLLFDITNYRDGILRKASNGGHTDIIDFLFEKMDFKTYYDQFCDGVIFDYKLHNSKFYLGLECFIRNINKRKLKIGKKLFKEMVITCIEEGFTDLFLQLFLFTEKYTKYMNFRNNYNHTPLMLAAIWINEEILEILLDHSDYCACDYDVIGDSGKTALIIFSASEVENTALFRKLLIRTKDINIYDHSNFSAFYYCIRNEKLDYIKIMFEDPRLIKDSEKIENILNRVSQETREFYNSLK